MRNAHAHVTRAFDADGRLIAEVQSGFRVESAYDLIGNRMRRVTGASNTVTVNYDLLDQPICISVNDEAPITIERDVLGRAVNEQLSSRLTRRFTYTDEGLLASQKLQLDHAPLLDTRYDYDRRGNLVRRTDSQFGTDTYQHDPMGRVLAHVDPAGKLTTWLNDPAGDRLQTQVRETRMRKVVGGDNETEWSREGAYNGLHYVFDRAGNLVSRTNAQEQGQATLHLDWDANQRLHESRWEGGERKERRTMYGYDPSGRRVSKRSAAQVTHFFWDGDSLLGEVTVAVDAATDPMQGGKVLDLETRKRKGGASQAIYRNVKEYFYRPVTFEPLVLIDRSVPASPALYHYHNDPNGCPTRLTAQDGKVLWAARHDAWGTARTSGGGGVDQPIRLQGQYHDAETGLHYNRFRYFDPSNGEFISQDPTGLEAGDNPYFFAPNSQAWADPLGLDELYALLAERDGWYPVMEYGERQPIGEIFLRKGELWKLGETRNPMHRYSAAWLRRNNLRYTTVYRGTTKQVNRLFERMKISGYLAWKGHLPPGNKCLH